MSKKLLTEFFELCKDGICQDLLTEREKREVSNGATYLSGRIQAADTPNGNGRVYPKKVLEKEMKNYLNVVKDNRATGELDHPDDSVINLKNASHMVTEAWWDGNSVMGKVQVLNTDYVINLSYNNQKKISLNEEIEIMIRPESILIDQQSTFQGKISHKIFAGPYLRLFVKIPLDQQIIIDVQQTSNFNIGDQINLTIPDNSAIIIS